MVDDEGNYEPCETVGKFLDSKGSVGLLALLYSRPMTYSEVESEIDVASTTISRRRQDANNINILTVDLESDEHGTKHVYKLTDKGEFLADNMARRGIFTNYRKMQTHQELVEEQTEEVIDWARSNPSQLLAFSGFQEGNGEIFQGNRNGDSGEGTSESEQADTSTNDTTTEEENKTNDGKSETDDIPSPPSEDRSYDVDEQSENKAQGTLEDIVTETPDPEQGDNDPES